jgi:hypothetical protein
MRAVPLVAFVAGAYLLQWQETLPGIGLQAGLLTAKAFGLSA